MVVEVPGDDEAVATVVALATADHDRPADALGQEYRGGATAGVLHEHRARDAVLLDGPAVQLTHLAAAERNHGYLPSPQSPADPQPRALEQGLDLRPGNPGEVTRD